MDMNAPFEDAVARHGPTVLRVCRATLGQGADADDAWSETFLAALRAWPGLDEVTNVEAWLVRVARRKSIDVIRGRNRRALPSHDLPETTSTLGEPRGDHDVWNAVAALPQRQRLALAYHHLGGLTHAETADLLGSSPAAVRRAAADGMKQLRRIYQTDERGKGTLR